ncbi:MAG TPA: glycosyl hydrolase family 65 protein [Nitrospiraceae bacterium]|nr:glycosyl hydrolase family 65 protein [Nitrospiraceae bacterium]
MTPAFRLIPFTPPLTIDPHWALVEEGFSLAREHEIESICTVANGYVGTRGSLAEGTSLSSPATFLAGVFEAGDEPAASLALVALPDWTQFRVVVDRVPLSLETGDILEHRRILDLQHGLLYRTWRHRDRTGRVTYLQFVRMVSLHDRHLLLQSIMISPENYGGVLAIESSTEVQDERMPRIQWLPKLEGERAVIVGTTTRGVTMAMVDHSEVRSEEGRSVERVSEVQADGLIERWACSAHTSEVFRFTRLVAVYSSRDTKDPAGAASEHLRRAQEAGLDVHIEDHARAWEERWRATGLEVIGDETAQRALRVAAYHLISAVNPNDEYSSIGARGLTGPVYKGHVFWDTEIYLLPFYTFTDPPAARALLMYRFHTLPAAREKARRLGYRGALYAWESADTGEDVTPDSAVAPDGRVVQILTGTQEHHISADIAYAVWQYWQATADEDFFVAAGLDILIETARFWATRGRLEPDGRYHIRAVIGPDEYHETVDDNAYTNVMAQWNLERAADAMEWLRINRADAWRAISDRLHIKPDEPTSWRRLAEVMTTGFDPRSNLFEQFAGFFQLEDLDLEAYRARTLPIDIVLGHERTQKSKVIKQADVVALSALLWDRFPYVVHEANFRYYEPRTAHGSSLSPAFHALVAARLGDIRLAAQYFQQAAEVDLATHMGNAAGGMHMATLGGLWQAAVFGIAGIRLRDDGLVIDPHLPLTWKQWSFGLQWRGRKVTIALSREPGSVIVDLQTGGPMTIELGEGAEKTVTQMEPRCRYIAHWTGSRWDEWQVKLQL